MTTRCPATHPDDGTRCGYTAGHSSLNNGASWFEHASPEDGVWWNDVPPRRSPGVLETELLRKSLTVVIYAKLLETLDDTQYYVHDMARDVAAVVVTTLVEIAAKQHET